MIAAIICAAGSSSRMGGKKKEFLPLSSCASVLGTAVNAFVLSKRVDLICIVVQPEFEAQARAELDPLQTRLVFTRGGPTRFASVHGALQDLVTLAPDFVLVHDGARPWIDPAFVNRVIDASLVYGAVVPVLPPIETPKEIEAGFVKRHLQRDTVGLAQTPQGFRFGELLCAYERAAQTNGEWTDDAAVWGAFWGPVAVIPGLRENKKITFPEDLGVKSNH